MAMTRVAVVTPILPVPGDPTRGRFIFETVKALSTEATVRTFLLQAQYPDALAPATQPRTLVGDDFQIPGLDVQALRYPAVPLLSRVTNGWVGGRRLTPAIAAFRPDVVIGYWVYPEGASALHAARRLGVPAVIGALGTDLNGRTGLNGWLTRRTLLAADAVINVSQAMSRHAIEHYGVAASRVHTIINGVNTQVFHPRAEGNAIRTSHGLPPQAPLIVYVGRLIEAKGLRELVEAFARLRGAHPDARLVVIGEGPFREALQAQITALGLQDAAQLMGGQLPDQVAQWVSTASLLTLPSWTEGYPNVLVEALACGCPIVATTVGGIPEIVTPERGVLVPPRDSNKLADAFDTVLTRAWNRTALAESMQRSWRDVARETLAVCESLRPRNNK